MIFQEGFAMRLISVGVAILLASIFSSGQSFGQDTAGPTRPMPPTNLQVFDSKNPNATVTTLNIYFDAYGSGVSYEDRAALQKILERFSDADLQTLANGTRPGVLGLKRSSALTEADWRPLVSAYAKAMLIDRDRKSTRLWGIFMMVIGVIFGVLGTKSTEYALRKFQGNRTATTASE